MEDSLRFICILLAFMSLSLSSATVQAADPVGKVVRLQATAQAVTPQGTRALNSGGPVFNNDRLVTGPDARLEVSLLDDSSLTLGGDAEFIISELDLTPGTEAGNMELLKGAFLLVTGTVAKVAPERYRVSTPFATIGIRGTTFWGGPLDDPFSVLLLDGEIEVRNPGGSVILKPNQGTDIASPDAKPEAPGAWSDDKRTRAFATITFNEN